MHFYHFLGIGGIGMSALARIALQRGYSVSGRDIRESALISSLRKEGAAIVCSPCCMKPRQSCQTLVFSSAIAPKERAMWLSRCRQFLHRSELLKYFLTGKKGIFIAGAHGKTTVSCLLAYIFEVASQEPSFVIGGLSPSLLNMNGKAGKGEYFIVEADESDASFLQGVPYGAILLNAEADHLDFWGDPRILSAAYRQFIDKVQHKELFFYSMDDPLLSSWNLRYGFSFGFSREARICILHRQFLDRGEKFDLFIEGRTYCGIEIGLIGRHNVFNAAACFAFAIQLGIEEVAVRYACQTFRGVRRRIEYKGEIRGALIYDDYAHHPTEIRATLSAVASHFAHRRMTVIVQFHRFSRLHTFFYDFLGVWNCVFRLIVTDIYSAGESDGVYAKTIETFLFELKKYREVIYVARSELEDFIMQLKLSSQDLVVTIGAGDVSDVWQAILAVT